MFPIPLRPLRCSVWAWQKHHVYLCPMALPWHLEVGQHEKSAATGQDCLPFCLQAPLCPCPLRAVKHLLVCWTAFSLIQIGLRNVGHHDLTISYLFHTHFYYTAILKLFIPPFKKCLHSGVTHQVFAKSSCCYSGEWKLHESTRKHWLLDSIVVLDSEEPHIWQAGMGWGDLGMALCPRYIGYLTIPQLPDSVLLKICLSCIFELWFPMCEMEKIKPGLQGCCED